MLIPYASYVYFDGKTFTYYCDDHVPKDIKVSILDDRIPCMKRCTVCKQELSTKTLTCMLCEETVSIFSSRQRHLHDKHNITWNNAFQLKDKVFK